MTTQPKEFRFTADEFLAWADEQPWIGGAIAVWHDGAVYATTRTELAA